MSQSANLSHGLGVDRDPFSWRLKQGEDWEKIIFVSKRYLFQRIFCQRLIYKVWGKLFLWEEVGMKTGREQRATAATESVIVDNGLCKSGTNWLSDFPYAHKSILETDWLNKPRLDMDLGCQVHQVEFGANRLIQPSRAQGAVTFICSFLLREDTKKRTIR